MKNNFQGPEYKRTDEQGSSVVIESYGDYFCKRSNNWGNNGGKFVENIYRRIMSPTARLRTENGV